MTDEWRICFPLSPHIQTYCHKYSHLAHEKCIMVMFNISDKLKDFVPLWLDKKCTVTKLEKDHLLLPNDLPNYMFWIRCFSSYSKQKSTKKDIRYEYISTLLHY